MPQLPIDSDAYPTAELVPEKRRWLLWLVPLLALSVVLWLGYSAWQQRGLTITIEFAHGHGLKIGDALRYRGVRVGQVDQITLYPGLDGLVVSVRVDSAARGLARSGSRYWIVRPQLDLSGVAGLDTLVGANYLGVLPGEGLFQRRFVGLAEPPLLELMEPGGLEIVLVTPGKGGLRPGAPVSYRQVIIGVVVAVGLARDASAVEARAYIKPTYVNLIRENCKFWRIGRAHLSAGLDGLSVDLDPIPSLVLGGVNLAIPPDPGKRAGTGAKFVLHHKPEQEWQDWVPGLALAAERELVRVWPTLLPTLLQWRTTSWYYLPKDEQRRAWVIALDGELIGPADALLVPENARTGSSRLQLGDEFAEVVAERISEQLARVLLEHNYPAWPSDQVRWPEQSENVLVSVGPDRPTRFVGVERQRRGNGDWFLQPALPFDSGWHGAAVIAESDAKLVGVLLVSDESFRVVPIERAVAESVD